MIEYSFATINHEIFLSPIIFWGNILMVNRWFIVGYSWLIVVELYSIILLDFIVVKLYLDIRPVAFI